MTLHLYEDSIPADAPLVYLPAGARGVYLREGSVDFIFDDHSQAIEHGCGITSTGQVTLKVGSAAVRLWRWELLPESLPAEAGLLRSAPAATSRHVLGDEVDMDERYTWLIRLDRVQFPPGGIAWTHIHQGPGIRVCLTGEITIETGGTVREYGPGEAWAEKGVLPVLAPTTEEEPTIFIRCFLLPSQNKGASSFRNVLPEDRSKPNTQNYHVFSERILY